MNHPKRLLLAILLGALQPGFAMQLGASKGLAVFGNPLDLTIPVRFDAPTEDPFNCFSAEVFQGDTKFDAGRVRIDVIPANNGLDATVRIRSISAVVEPWAKVILRSQCGAKVTRQYDFLTDFVADMPAINQQAESTVAVSNLPSTPSVTVSNTLPLLPQVASKSAPISNGSVKRTQNASQATNQASVQSPATTPRTVKPASAAPKPTELAAKSATANALGQVANIGQSRLKMETFELTDEHQVLLKLSTAMLEPSGMRTPEEIQALAQATAVWRAINGMPALTPNSTNAPTVTPPAAQPAVVASIAAQAPLNAKDKQAFSDPLVYGLMGLLALTLACIAWLWIRMRKGIQASNTWLQEAALEQEPALNEPTQFLESAYTEAALVPEELVDEFAELDDTHNIDNTEFETDKPQLAEAAFSASPLAVLLSNKETDALNKQLAAKKISEQDIASKEFSSANAPARKPAHFDDSRFDEHHLNAQKIARQPVHDRPIISPTELMDLVLDTPPKLRSVPSPVPSADAVTDFLLEPQAPSQKPFPPKPKVTPKQESVAKTEVETKTETKPDPKGNLIDFEIFADQMPLPKPSRFGG